VAADDRRSPLVLARVWHGERALNQYPDDMHNNADDVVGQLTIADATLCYLLLDILREAEDRNPGEMTTGQVSRKLLDLAKRDPTLLTSDITDWLERVKRATVKRNEVVHAVARDRCVMCGQATQFEHRGSPVDRSPAGVRLVTSEFTTLINEGVKLAALISDRINAREVAKAQDLARSTGNAQSPKQILIGQSWHRCTTCSQTGVAEVVVALPTAVAVLPPQP
jgi:hypothetical protein